MQSVHDDKKEEVFLVTDQKNDPYNFPFLPQLANDSKSSNKPKNEGTNERVSKRRIKK